MDGSTGGRERYYGATPVNSPPASLFANRLGGITEFLAILKRRRFAIGLTALVIIGIALGIVQSLTPRYAANADVIIDSRKTDVVALAPVVGNLAAEDRPLRSEIDVLRSRQLAERVAAKLGLYTNPVFTRDIIFTEETAIPAWERKLPPSVLPYLLPVTNFFKISNKVTDTTVAENLQFASALVINKLLDKTLISNDGKSNTIRITVESESPELAAQIANTYADLYLVEQLEAKFEQTKKANDWLSDRLKELKDAVTRADNAVAAYRAANNLVSTNVQGQSVIRAQLETLNNQLAVAQADYAQAESRMRDYQSAIRNGSAGSAAPEVVSSGTIAALRGQETEAIRKLADLQGRFGPRYPAVLTAEGELKDIRTQIGREIDKIGQSLNQAAGAARIRVEQLRSQIAQLTKSTSASDTASVRLQELEREAQSNRVLYENFLTRYKETTEQTDLAQADARIISRADVPVLPTFPNKRVLMLMSALVAGMIGFFVALLLERFDNGIRNAEAIEDMTGALCLAMVPNVASFGAVKPHDVVLTKPMSQFAETIRAVSNGLRSMDIDKPPRVILVTSSLPEEGKSLTALSIARSAAFSGQKVLLVDCDLRKPTVLKTLGGDPNRTIFELFEGVCSFDDVINVDQTAVSPDYARRTPLEYIGARARSVLNPQQFLSSEKMRSFIRDMASHYDLVVFDTPPMMAATDAAVLARQVDASLFVARWEKTPRNTIGYAIKQFVQLGGEITGVAITRVNVRKHKRWNYGDHGHYYGKYKAYAE